MLYGLNYYSKGDRQRYYYYCDDISLSCFRLTLKIHQKQRVFDRIGIVILLKFVKFTPKLRSTWFEHLRVQ